MYWNIRHLPLRRRLRLSFDWNLHLGLHRSRSDFILRLPHDNSHLALIVIISKSRRSNLSQHDIECSAGLLVTATPQPQP
jgi:hypothetical protein